MPRVARKSALAEAVTVPTRALSRSEGPTTEVSCSLVRDEAIPAVNPEIVITAANIHTSATRRPAIVTGALSP